MLIFGVVALSSCEKVERDAVNPVVEQSTISHIMADSTEITAYRFAGEQLIQVSHYNKKSGEVERFQKYEYDSKNKVTKVNTHSSNNHSVLSEALFSYNTSGGLTKAATAYFSNNAVAYNTYSTFEYDSNKNLQKINVFEGEEKADGSAGKLKSYTVFEVLPNGNYTQEKQYIIDDKGNAQLYATTTYSYDSNNNPFYKTAEPGTAVSPNNIISATTLINSSKKEYTYSYAYTYDERGYPQTQTVTNPDGKRETFTYLYSN